MRLDPLAYHLRILADCGLIRKVSTQQKRGAIETFFAPNFGKFETWVGEILDATEKQDERAAKHGKKS